MCYYVSMTDRFLSGWGKAEGKIAKFIIECDNIQQAKQVKRVATRRSEMARVNICGNKPRYSNLNHQVTVHHFNDLSGSWKEGYIE